MPVDEVQKLINAIDNNKTEFTYSPIITEKLRELVKIPESEKKLADELKQQTKNINELKKQLDNGLEKTKNELKDELRQTKDEFKQQMKIIQELLDNFIKNSNNNSE